MWCSPRRRNFNPRTPRGVRRPEPQRLKPMSDFNPRTPRGVRPPTKGIMLGGFFISIHAPREGCDSRCPQPELPKTQFQSTHPARGATRISTHCCVTCTFQSTHPARGATRCSRGCLDTRSNFNPRTPRGVRPLFVSAFDQYDYDFNPRTPRGVRPHHIIDLYLCAFISIHAPREGCDAFLPRSGRPADHFNPRTPRGVRREVLDNGVVVHGNSNPRTPRGVRPRRKGLHWITDRFQSTHPARGATAGSWPTTSPNANFNPRTPRGVRRHRRPGRP